IPDTEERHGETVRRRTKSESRMAQAAKRQGRAFCVRSAYRGKHGNLHRGAIRNALGGYGQAVGERCRRPRGIQEGRRTLRRESDRNLLRVLAEVEQPV